MNSRSGKLLVPGLRTVCYERVMLVLFLLHSASGCEFIDLRLEMCARLCILFKSIFLEVVTLSRLNLINHLRKQILAACMQILFLSHTSGIPDLYTPTRSKFVGYTEQAEMLPQCKTPIRVIQV